MPTVSAKEIGDPEVLVTGTFLDDLTGRGGLPFERIVELIGEQKTGKSTASFHIIAAAQKADIKCLLIDVEHSLTAKYAEDLGIDTDKLDVVRAKYAEDYLNETVAACEGGEYRVIVLDSIGSLSSRVEAEKEVGEKSIGQQASLMSVFVRKIAPMVSYNKILFVGINHLRDQIGSMSQAKIAMGGKNWSEKKKLSLRFRETGESVTQGTDELGKPRVVGKWIEVKVEKNAIGPTEKKVVRVPLILGKGFDAGANLLQQAIDQGVFEKQGNTYFFSGEKIGMKSKLTEWFEAEENVERVKQALGK